jgi:hypothetical protein
VGDFCDVFDAPLVFPRPVAEVVVREARLQAVRIAALNDYWDAACQDGWGYLPVAGR